MNNGQKRSLNGQPLPRRLPLLGAQPGAPVRRVMPFHRPVPPSQPMAQAPLPRDCRSNSSPEIMVVGTVEGGESNGGPRPSSASSDEIQFLGTSQRVPDDNAIGQIPYPPYPPPIAAAMNQGQVSAPPVPHMHCRQGPCGPLHPLQPAMNSALAPPPQVNRLPQRPPHPTIPAINTTTPLPGARPGAPTIRALPPHQRVPLNQPMEQAQMQPQFGLRQSHEIQAPRLRGNHQRGSMVDHLPPSLAPAVAPDFNQGAGLPQQNFNLRQSGPPFPPPASSWSSTKGGASTNGHNVLQMPPARYPQPPQPHHLPPFGQGNQGALRHPQNLREFYPQRPGQPPAQPPMNSIVNRRNPPFSSQSATLDSRMAALLQPPPPPPESSAQRAPSPPAPQSERGAPLPLLSAAPRQNLRANPPHQPHQPEEMNLVYPMHREPNSAFFMTRLLVPSAPVDWPPAPCPSPQPELPTDVQVVEEGNNVPIRGCRDCNYRTCCQWRRKNSGNMHKWKKMYQKFVDEQNYRKMLEELLKNRE